MASPDPTRLATIYVLCDSRIADPIARVRYVGRTVWPIARRLHWHCYAARHGDRSWRGAWIRAVYAAGGDVLIEAVASVPFVWCDAAEIDTIAKYRALGCRLTNLTDGGGGILNATAETRAKIGDTSRGNTYWVGRKHTPASRAKMSASQRGRVMHPNTRAALYAPAARAKIAAALRARTLTPAELARKQVTARHALHSPDARARQLAGVRTPEHRAAISARQSTPESKARLRQLGLAGKGRKMTAAWCLQRAAYARLHRHSDATKETMGAWQRGSDSHRAKLTWAQVDAIRARHAVGDASQHQLAREFQVTPRAINLIVHNKTWVR